MEIEKIKERLVELPAKIYDKEQVLFKEVQHYEELLVRHKLLDLNTFKAVLVETNEEGKKVFTNDTLRKEEVERRLGEHSEYKSIKEELTNLKVKIEELKLAISFMKRQNANARSLVQLYVGEDNGN